MFPYNLIGAITGRNHLDFLVKATGAQESALIISMKINGIDGIHKPIKSNSFEIY
jgi:hypothetical protein